MIHLRNNNQNIAYKAKDQEFPLEFIPVFSGALLRQRIGCDQKITVIKLTKQHNPVKKVHW